MASEYGWTKDYILYEIYIDEVFFILENIKKRKNQEFLMQIQINSFPHMEEKSRKEILEIFKEENKKSTININQKTDFSALDKAKMQFNSKN
ncbi:hypothetical protein [Candidatus Contubernalis alkaliaceticus]|uniref:hypothetical protein n=1 Tax=Candidatus Contubernalis alkaliaceticus TaxID=338645 RepID=UPI001F4BF70D|nr:hypothetical protein [Candidatus Contubernalis alkalaceticus]UNC92707.1 hypothetical protein HUE98_11740 [Candidatus Contubernalis alkalaceticus]